MARVTIVGSGIVGMATAALLSRNYEVTIVAKNLPGDKPSVDWASPWAGACFVAGGCSSAREVKMQLDAFAELWRWSFAFPESSLRRITIEDFFEDEKLKDEMWWKDFMPEFKFLPSDKLPKGAKFGTSYKTVVLTPSVFLSWLRQRLEGLGVTFKRMHLKCLSDAKSLGHDVLINATGFGSQRLTDVNDQDVQKIRGQTLVVKSDYQKIFMHDNGKDYTYVIPRLDGTVILGGIRQFDSSNEHVDWAISQDIVRRVHENLPEQFSANLSDYNIIGHNVGFRPGRTSGIRIEKEVKNGQKIVHAYGFAGGGYISSFGAARIVRDYVDDFLFDYPVAKL